MLDGCNNDLLSNLIHTVVDDVSIAARDNLADTLDPLRAAGHREATEHAKGLEDCFPDTRRGCRVICGVVALLGVR